MYNKNDKSIGLVSENMSDKIMGALKILDEAASEKGHEIKTTINQSFKGLHRALNEAESGSDAAMDMIQKKGKHLRDSAMTQSSKAIASINHEFETKPWLFLGGAAFLGMSLGYLLGRSTRGGR